MSKPYRTLGVPDVSPQEIQVAYHALQDPPARRIRWEEKKRRCSYMPHHAYCSNTPTSLLYLRNATKFILHTCATLLRINRTLMRTISGNCTSEERVELSQAQPNSRPDIAGDIYRASGGAVPGELRRSLLDGSYVSVPICDHRALR